ncbi:MAG: hypothetical protein AMJ79_08180 [Phycisphaerae bacterium SM23_30]|nr:MAG: hypothetical protein AMJ79_08180 [Phycisphaerae bacterium SM23_30]
MAGRIFYVSFVLAAVCAFIVVSEASGATIIYVNDSAPSDPGPGDPTVSDPLENGSINHPFDAIQEAVNAASAGDTVIVADGTYTGAGNRDIDFLGKAITLRSINGPENCIINCQGSWSNPHRGFYFKSQETPASVVKGFTITNGYAGEGMVILKSGGGIMCEQNCDPSILECVITNCIAEGSGGGICSWLSSPTISGCTIRDNTCIHGRGGGIYTKHGTVKINACKILNNAAQGISFVGGGGGVYLHFGNPTVSNCTLSNNQAKGSGGGIFFCDSDAMMSNCEIRDNTTEEYGGGIRCYRGSQTIRNCIVSGNMAESNGGGISVRECDTVLGNCTITANQSQGVADSAGGIHGHASTTTITNCIFWNNTPNEGGGYYQVSLDINYSVFPGGTQGAGNIDADPLFKSSSDYRLQYGSVCLEAGTNNPAGGLEATDIAGAPRIADADMDGQAIVDMGAYEAAPSDWPVIWLSDEEIYFRAGEDEANPPDQQFTLRNLWLGTLNWRIEYDCEWLEIEPVSGSTTDETELITVHVNSYILERGSYQCTLTVSAPQALNSPQKIVINLEVVGPTIELSQRTFEFTVLIVDPNVPEQTLYLRNAGEGVLEWSIKQVTPGAWVRINPTSGSTVDETEEIKLGIDISNLETGSYSCYFQVSALGAENSPQYFGVLLELVHPVIALDQNKFEFIAYLGGGNPPKQYLRIRNGDGGILKWQIIETCSWLEVNPKEGFAEEVYTKVDLSVDTGGLEAGKYDCELIISDPIAANNPQIAKVELLLIGPIIDLSTDELMFEAYEGGSNPAEQELMIGNIGGGILNWQMEENCDWLEADPMSGSLSMNEPSEIITLSVDVTNLKDGAHICYLTISDPHADNSPQTVEVTFDVTGPIIDNSTIEIEFFGYEDGPSPEEQVFTIGNTGGGILNWQINYTCDWLAVIPVSGSVYMGETSEEITVSVDVTGLTWGDYYCNLIISDPDAENSPQTLLVHLHVYGEIHVPRDIPTIQEAIDAFTIYDTAIIVADGTYRGAGNRNIYFRGKAVTVRSRNGPKNCTLDCQGSSYRPHRGFLFIEGEGADSILDGFTIKNGYSDGRGGGILCQGSSPTIRNCIIHSNQAKYSGGGIGCTMGSAAVISHCTFSDNHSQVDGGGVVVYKDSIPTINYCTFNNNSADLGGGGISCFESDATINRCTISNNRANYGGGVFSNNFCAVWIKDCIIYDNTADSYGGGICLFSFDSSTVSNCIICGNQAAAGGGVCNLESYQSILKHCTFTANTAAEGAAVACNSFGSPTSLEAVNCILWDGGGEVWVGWNSTVEITYSDVQGGRPGEGNIDADPFFVEPYAPNPDPNQVSGDFRLQRGSGCIDAGCEAGVYEDMEGNIRPWDYPGVDNNGALPEFDMGAYENYPFTGPFINVSNRQVEFKAFVGEDNPGEETIIIRNVSVGALHWQILFNCPWLIVDPYQGISSGEMNEVTLWAEITGLNRGSYHCDLTIFDLYALNNPQTVHVELQMLETGRFYVPDEYASIQSAIDAAAAGDEVIVADGIYTGPGNRDVENRGKSITIRSENGPQNCVIDCQGSSSEIHRGFTLSEGSAANFAVLVEGFTIKNGFADNGGGIYCEDFDADIINCILINNQSTGNGGAIYRGLVSNCVITDNRAGGDGGGVYDVTIGNCTITANHAEGNGGGIFGGMISACTITGNHAESNGGGVYDGTIGNCTITGNHAEGNGGGIFGGAISACTVNNNTAGVDGGGIYRQSGDINNCAISANVAHNEGGGIYSEYEIGMISNCTISGNNAVTKGGGIYYLGRSKYSKIINCIISGNTAELGAGIAFFCQSYYSSYPVIINCTFSGNTASGYGGALYSTGDNAFRINNCILWGDFPDEIYYIDYQPLIYYSNIQNGWEWEGFNGNIAVDPLFVSDHDFHLLPESPSIDTGTNYPSGGLPTTDIEGNPRKVDGDLDGWAEADMGAYEFQITGPYIKLSYPKFAFAAYEGGINPPSEKLYIYKIGHDVLNWHIDYDCDWLTVDPLAGSAGAEGAEIILEPNITGLSGGDYYCELIITDPGAVNSPRSVVVNLKVTGAVIGLSPSGLNFTATEGGANPPDQAFTIVNTGGGTLHWHIDCNCAWLEVDPSGGSCMRGEADEVTLSADISGLSRGIYTYDLEIADPEAENSPQTLEIYLYIGGKIYVPAEYPTIQAAIDAAIKGDTVIIADGTYTGEGNRDINFKGKPITVKSENGPVNCIIDCQGSSGYRCRGFYFHNGEKSDSVLEGITIANGYGDSFNGGGIYCNQSSPTIRNCNIINNTARDGGGIFCNQSSPTIQNCNIINNTSFDYGGGGILCYRSSPTIQDCNIINNSASNKGGGIYCRDYSSPMITGCFIRGNTAKYGGGIYCYKNDKSDPTISRCLITENTANSSGGGIECYNSSPVILNCLITQNTAHYGGGIDCFAYDYKHGRPSIINCTIMGNNGGGIEIHSNYYYPRIVNSILWDNVTEEIDSYEGLPRVSYSNVKGGWEGEGNIDVDPMFVDAANGDYHLQRGSPCIDAGCDAGVYEDMEGNIRPCPAVGLSGGG